MKKLLLLSTILLISCSKNCDEEKLAAYNKYVENLQYTNGNQAAQAEMYQRYQERVADIEDRCE